ncbi:hypothetical protein ABOM_004936 [Aspergillus bombycis]|uniref:BZIP domain-containing protein n=1 Tax=Aspergillus bombycis TaxID=109264 RepID=A0A1F8A350_9EURO|nr:hypothetical protein ABOM_004936 [Aspergillus bombycis]OGM46152.1 hypothetical protein ABOM_004936 [Aspergillus bombycis]
MSEDPKYPYPWMRERRREQNARAKRRSRQRQKARQVAGLEVVKQSEGRLQLAVSAVPEPLYHVSNHPAISPCCMQHHRSAKPHLLYRELLGYFASVSDLENVAKILDAEQLGVASILKYGIIAMGGALDNHLFDLANQTCFCCWLELIKSDLKVSFNFGLALYSGVRRLSQMKGPSRWSIDAVGINTARMLLQIEPQSSDLRTIKLTSFSSTSAFLENARQLGLSLGDFVDDGSESPFCSRYQPISYHTLAADLQPTPEQLKIPHHPYLDIVPFPSFRAKALRAISSGTPAFNEDELCFDLAHDSMRCWGSTATSLHGRGNGTPWDARSWEVSPWFLKKWGFLVGNEDDAIYQNSLWWWSQR